MVIGTQAPGASIDRRVTALATALLLGLVGGSSAAEPASARPALPHSFADIVQNVIPVVVNISTTQTVKRPDLPGGRPGDPMEEFMRRFYDQLPKSYKQRSLGSGVIISASGEILTNDHVVGSADEVDVTLPDHAHFKAKLVGKDKKSDVALIRIQADHPFPVAKLGRSDELRVGDWVIAIGNPFALGETVTAGIVSAKGRAIGAGPYDDFIQTDASINPGNSGGPLLNTKGEVVGINSAIYSQSGGNIGIGFAIPIETAVRIADALRTRGKVVRGWLGVAIQDVTPEIAKAMSIKESTGALVADVIKDGPAERAGIQRGDVILSYQGKAIASSRDLPIRVAETPVGTRAEVRLQREGEEKTIVAEIAELKDKEIPSETADVGGGLGLQVDRITPQMAERLGAPADTVGVVITNVEPGSAAEDADLRPGDIIREVDRKPVDSPAAFENAVKGRVEATPILLLIDRGGSTLFVTVGPESGAEGGERGEGESDADEPQSGGGFEDEPSDGESFGEMKRFPSL